MNWKQYFTTSIGKKLVMSFTGLFLITFLLVHCYINALVFWPDHGSQFTAAARFMGSNVVIRTVEIGLMAGFVIHIIQGLLLWRQNSSKRKMGYAVNRRNRSSAWYSRSMGLLGTLILIFLVIHLSKFWIPNRYSQIVNGHELDLFSRMLEEFTNPLIVVVYVLGCLSLSIHLMHGFYSAFQTLGLTAHRYIKLIRGTGYAFSIIIPFIFAAMPVSIYFGWVRA